VACARGCNSTACLLARLFVCPLRHKSVDRRLSPDASPALLCRQNHLFMETLTAVSAEQKRQAEVQQVLSRSTKKGTRPGKEEVHASYCRGLLINGINLQAFEVPCTVAVLSLDFKLLMQTITVAPVLHHWSLCTHGAHP
jgi:hypothetical protein